MLMNNIKIKQINNKLINIIMNKIYNLIINKIKIMIIYNKYIMKVKIYKQIILIMINIIHNNINQIYYIMYKKKILECKLKKIDNNQ